MPNDDLGIDEMSLINNDHLDDELITNGDRRASIEIDDCDDVETNPTQNPTEVKISFLLLENWLGILLHLKSH